MDHLNLLFSGIYHSGIPGYLLLFLISFAESLAFVGLLIPGTIIVVGFGFLASRGDFNVVSLIWATILGAIAGDGLSFYLGKKGFKNVFTRIKTDYLFKGEKFFKKHGNKSILLGRFIGPIRPIIPFVAGMFKMETKRFLAYDIFSGILWGVSMILIGFFFGYAWRAVEIWSSRVGLFLAFIGILFVFWYFLKQLAINQGKQFFDFLKSLILSIYQGFISNKYIAKFIDKHPDFTLFIKNRFTHKRFTGITLTFLVLIFTYIFILFLGIIEDFITADPIIAADHRIENFLTLFHSPPLIKIAFWISAFGHEIIVTTFVLMAIFLFWVWKKREYIIPLLVSVLGTELFVYLGKLAFARPRPDSAVYFENGFSFPSGHAAISIALYGFLVYFLFKNNKSSRTKVNSLFVALFAILLIGFSRLYLGVHYLSDVWAGYLTGFLWLLSAISLCEWLTFKTRQLTISQEIAHGRYKKIASIGLVILSLIFYGYFSWSFNPPMKNTEIILSHQVVKGRIQDILINYQLPKSADNLIGTRHYALNIIMVAKDDQDLIAQMKKKNLEPAVPILFSTFLSMEYRAIFNESYQPSPISPYFWNNIPQDFSFEKPSSKNTARERYFARIWKTNLKTANGDTIYVGFSGIETWGKFTLKYNIKEQAL